MRISDWSSDVCSSDLQEVSGLHPGGPVRWEPPDSSARGASGLNIRPEADSARPSVARRARGVERDRRGAGDVADAGAGVHVQRDLALEHQVAFHHRIGPDHDARLAIAAELDRQPGRVLLVDLQPAAYVRVDAAGAVAVDGLDVAATPGGDDADRAVDRFDALGAVAPAAHADAPVAPPVRP